jgi:hypothetical protein
MSNRSKEATAFLAVKKMIWKRFLAASENWFQTKVKEANKNR